MTEPSDHLLDELRPLEESLWHEDTRYDEAHVTATFHPDFEEVGQSGRVWTMNTMHRSGGPIGVELPLPELRVREVAPGVALTSYLSRKTDGSGTARRTSLWLRTDDGWRIRWHQGTRADV